MSLIPNENLRGRSDYPGDDCQRYIDELAKLKADNDELVEALEKARAALVDAHDALGTTYTVYAIYQINEILANHKASMGEK